MKDALRGWAKYPLSLVVALFVIVGAARCAPSTPAAEDEGDHSVPAPTIWLDGYELGRAKADPVTAGEYARSQR